MDSPSTTAETYPVAEVRPAQKPNEIGVVVVSRLWLATLLCLVIAVVLVGVQLRARGPKIEVRFSAGHGLQPGDAVRYRGIDVGEVKEVVLNEKLDGVTVWIELTEASAALAREGSRFWIERPDISIGQVRGLETLVGGRYVGVVPGPEDAPASSLFYGLDVASAPVDNIADGLEIILEASNRQGLQNGSTVSYRGVVVGHILSVGLSNDSVTVEARAFVEPKYRDLIRENTEFWSNSGLDVSIGFSGIELDAETLATIASGGVAFATPNTPGRPAATGHRFQLYESPQDRWLTWQPRVALGSAALPLGLPVPSPLLGIRRPSGAMALLGAGRERAWLLPLTEGRLLGPANMLTGEEEESDLLEITGQQFALPLEGLVTTEHLAIAKWRAAKGQGVVTWPKDRLRIADEREEVVVTCGSEVMTMPLPAQRLTVVEEGWEVDASIPLDDAWHGACVLSARDGAVIGMLVRKDDRSLIALLTQKLLESLVAKAKSSSRS
ncbi:MAG: MlaD family protein [Pirellulales bacterium]|nr:MlaD family protein [Pirellulales bacterium]